SDFCLPRPNEPRWHLATLGSNCHSNQTDSIISCGAPAVAADDLHHPRISTRITQPTKVLLSLFNVMGNEAEEELLMKLADGGIPHAYVTPRMHMPIPSVATTSANASPVIYFPPRKLGPNCSTGSSHG